MRRSFILIAVLSLLTATSANAQDAAADDRAALQEGVTQLETGKTEQALARFGALLDRDVPSARYYFAKALYRAGYLHAALAEFDVVLSEGPEGRFFAASLEWCLFIGRKLVDDVAVNEVLVRHGNGRFPERYRDEFVFQLARYHYTRAWVDSTAAATPPKPAPPAEDKSGISFEEDLFGDDSEEQRPAPGRPRAPAPKKDEGISFEDDLFGDEEPKTPSRASTAEAPPSGDAEMTPAQHRKAARRLVTRIGSTSPFYPKVKFLEGLLELQSGKENKALAAFKAVVDGTKGDLEGEDEDERRRRTRLRELAFFQLARLHFGARQPSFSIFYYKKVERDSLQWLDSLYEASWAEYRLGRYERALGNLLTVNAPFFQDSYYPESLILEAVIYYENCRYQEAGRIINGFLARYEPVFAELEKMAAEERAPEAWYSLLATLDEKDSEQDQLLAQVLSIALSDPELRRLDASIKEVRSERDALAASSKRAPLAGTARVERLLESLDAERADLESAAGAAVERKLRFEAKAVKTLVAQALRVQVETARAEEGRLEASLAQRNQRPKRVERPVVNWTDDEKLVWPFEGEYWRDELGTYELTLARTCR